MKRKIAYFLLPMLMISFDLKANPVVADVGLAATEAAAGRQVLGTIGKILVAKTMLKHKKAIIGMSILIGVGGFAGYKITKEKFIEMLEHPEDHEDMMQTLIEDHPIKYQIFKKFLDYNVEKTDDIEYRQAILNFEDYFHIGKEDKIYEMIKSSQQYSFYLNLIKNKVNTIKSEYEKDPKKPVCNLEFYNNLINHPYDIDKNIGLWSNGYDGVYQVDRYGNFKKINKEITADHIPSYKAVEKFLRNKGLSLSVKRNENGNLDRNLTAINILTIEHSKGSRTFAGRNKALLSNIDSLNLLNATIEDIAIFATYLSLNRGKSPLPYLDSSYILLKRNFYLCIYE